MKEHCKTLLLLSQISMWLMFVCLGAGLIVAAFVGPNPLTYIAHGLALACLFIQMLLVRAFIRWGHENRIVKWKEGAEFNPLRKDGAA